MEERLGPFSVPPQPAVGHLCECRGGLRPEPAVGVSLRVPRRSAAGASVKRPLLRSGGFPARLFSAVRRLSCTARFCNPGGPLRAPPHRAPASRPRRGRRLPSAAPVCGSRLRLPSAAPVCRPGLSPPAYCSRFSRKMFRWASSGLRRSSSTNSTSSSTSATASR